ncbi:MAG: flagellar biosynthetic protein FliO [bacterium]
MVKKKLLFIGLILILSTIESTVLSQPAEFNESEKIIDSAKDVVKETPKKEKYDVNLFVLMGKTVVSLVIIAALIYFVLRFFLKGQRWLTRQQEFIQTIATHFLAPNKYIQIVEIGNKLLVLGISEHNINLLTEIEDKEVIDLIKTQVSRAEDKLQLSFIQHLKKRLMKPQLEQTDYEEKLKFLNKQREKLKSLEL